MVLKRTPSIHRRPEKVKIESQTQRRAAREREQGKPTSMSKWRTVEEKALQAHTFIVAEP
jgi:hypothetical protein